jgi:hypothetical protein
VRRSKQVAVRLVFADSGTFHELDLRFPAEVLGRHERIVDALREEPEVLARLYVDGRRLVAAYTLDDA